MSKLGFSFVGIKNGRIMVMLPDMTIKDEPHLFMTEAEAVALIAREGNNSIVFEDTCNNPGIHYRPAFKKESFKQDIINMRQKTKRISKGDGKAKEGQVPQSPNG